jgi:hypothetical protein
MSKSKYIGRIFKQNHPNGICIFKIEKFIVDNRMMIPRRYIAKMIIKNEYYNLDKEIMLLKDIYKSKELNEKEAFLEMI